MERKEGNSPQDRASGTSIAARTTPAGGSATVRSGARKPRADAPLRTAGRWLTAALHALVLAGIVSLLLGYVMHVSLAGPRALVSIIAPGLVHARSPVEGVFVAATDLPAGARVEKGQLLGHVQAPQLAEQIAGAAKRLESLHRRKLLVDAPGGQPATVGFESPREREFRECAAQIVATRGELDRLRRLGRRLRIVSPIDGRVQHEVRGSHAVVANQSVAAVWPRGGDLRLEVRAPLEVVHELLREECVDARFETAHGTVRVSSVPIPESLRVTPRQESAGRRQELWGLLECRPLALPEPIAYPGPIGEL